VAAPGEVLAKAKACYGKRLASVCYERQAISGALLAPDLSKEFYRILEVSEVLHHRKTSEDFRVRFCEFNFHEAFTEDA